MKKQSGKISVEQSMIREQGEQARVQAMIWEEENPNKSMIRLIKESKKLQFTR